MMPPKRRGISKEILDLIQHNSENGPRAVGDLGRPDPMPVYATKQHEWKNDSNSFTKGGWTPLGRAAKDSMRTGGTSSALRTVGRGVGKEFTDSFRRRR